MMMARRALAEEFVMSIRAMYLRVAIHTLFERREACEIVVQGCIRMAAQAKILNWPLGQ